MSRFAMSVSMFSTLGGMLTRKTKNVLTYLMLKRNSTVSFPFLNLVLLHAFVKFVVSMELYLLSGKCIYSDFVWISLLPASGFTLPLSLLQEVSSSSDSPRQRQTVNMNCALWAKSMKFGVRIGCFMLINIWYGATVKMYLVECYRGVSNMAAILTGSRMPKYRKLSEED